jgi:hypothetical protein
MPIPLDQAREIVEHRFHQRLLAIDLQPQHREIAVPVIDFAKAPAGHDIAGRKRQRGAARNGYDRLAYQLRPERADMRPEIARAAIILARHDEIGEHERLQGGAVRPRPRIGRHDRVRGALGHGIDERLAVREHVLLLHCAEQRAVHVRG